MDVRVHLSLFLAFYLSHAHTHTHTHTHSRSLSVQLVGVWSNSGDPAFSQSLFWLDGGRWGNGYPTKVLSVLATVVIDDTSYAHHLEKPIPPFHMRPLVGTG